MLSYRLVKKISNPAKTAVLLHGILANSAVWEPIATSLVSLHPQWQFVLFDLRGHGDSLSLSAPHCVASCSHDVLSSLQQQNLEPDLLIGHSFGGKVSLGMIMEDMDYFREKKIETWVLDISLIPLFARRCRCLCLHWHSLPIQMSNPDYSHVYKLIQCLKRLPPEFTEADYRRFLKDCKVHPQVLEWLMYNVVPSKPSCSASISSDPLRRLRVSYDIKVVEKLFISYSTVDYQCFLEEFLDPKVGIHFVRATKNPLWQSTTLQWFNQMVRVKNVHLHTILSNHSIHADNPSGLVKLLSIALE